MRRITTVTALAVVVLTACGDDASPLAPAGDVVESSPTTSWEWSGAHADAAITTVAAPPTTAATTPTAADPTTPPSAPAPDDGDDQGAVDALADSLASVEYTDLIVYLAGEHADMECWAGELVDALGAAGTIGMTQAVTEAEFIDVLGAFPDEDLNAAADGLAACLDRDGLRGEILEFESDEVADCVMDYALDRDTYRTMFISLVRGDESAMEDLEAALAGVCGFGS